MKRILCAFAAIGLLAGCDVLQPKPKPIEVSRSEIVNSAELALAAIEAGVASYKAQQPIPEDVLVKLRDADMRAHELIKQLRDAPAEEVPNRAKIFASSMQALASAIPPGVLPPQAQAGLVAFGVLAQVIAQTVPVQEPGVVLSTEPITSAPPVAITPEPAHPAAEAAAVGATPPTSKITN